MNSFFNKKIFALILFSILIILIGYLSKTLIPFFMGLLVAYLLDPLVDYLVENKIKKSYCNYYCIIIIFFNYFYIMPFNFSSIINSIK